MPSFQFFGNSRGKWYTKFVILDIKFSFTCDKSNQPALIHSVWPKYFGQDCLKSFLKEAFITFFVVLHTDVKRKWIQFSCNGNAPWESCDKWVYTLNINSEGEPPVDTNPKMNIFKEFTKYQKISWKLYKCTV